MGKTDPTNKTRVEKNDGRKKLLEARAKKKSDGKNRAQKTYEKTARVKKKMDQKRKLPEALFSNLVYTRK